MNIVIRNITKDTDVTLHLPMKKVLDEILNAEDEYIIVDHDETLQVSEYDNIRELNDFLLSCEENGISKETLALLSSNYSYSEVVNMVKEENYTIIDFTAETAGWNYGNGGDINSDDDKGRVLHSNGMLLFDWEKDVPITKEMEDYIKWEHLWTMAETLGWEAVNHSNRAYLMHK